MLVKAKWNVKDAAGWHKAGEVFETENALGEAVILIGEPRKPVVKEVVKEEPEQDTEAPAEEPKQEEPAEEPAEEPKREEPAVRSSRTRRKTTTAK